MRHPNPVVMRPEQCPREMWGARLQQLLSGSSWHHRPTLKPIDTWGTPTDFYQLWLTSLASGSCLFIYNVRGSLPGKIRQLISSLKEAI